MARIKPFKAVRPVREHVAQVASFPYDVVNTEEARELAKDNPFSFLHVVKSEIDLPENIDPYDPTVYEKARFNLDRLISEGAMFADNEERLYVYRQIMNGRSQASVVACCHVDDYWSDVIKKHEHTRADKEEDRIRHVRTTNANTGPVFLTYPARDTIDAIVNRTMTEDAEYDFTATDGIQHTVWIVKAPADIATLVEEFASMPALYVADGHHRSASAAKVGKALAAENPSHTGEEEYNFFLAAIFPDRQLHIMDYNRVIKDICGMTPDEFMDRVKERFEVEEIMQGPFRPEAPKQFGMFLENRWYKLTARSNAYDSKDPVGSLDVAILQHLLLQPILRIDDPRTDKRIHFVGGIRGLGELEKLVSSGCFKVAFALHPTSIKELMRIADIGKVMPPKSTWFEPKLRSGLLVHRLS